MNFPEIPLFQFLYWLINTSGLGGVAVGLLATSIFFAIGLTLRWISRGGKNSETEVYPYPTPALHQHDK